MAGKLEYRSMASINLNDHFFDTLKKEYSGDDPHSFVPWFTRKAKEGDQALVFEDEDGIGAFVKLKFGENESIPLLDGSSLPAEPKVKISTIRISERFRNQRIGEGALGLTLWKWRDSGINTIYVTVFDNHTDLIILLEKFGFVYAGKNTNGECVYIKDRRHLDFTDPCKAFPFLSDSIQNAGCLAIDMDYHDTMFAFSELANTLQERVDISVTNGLKKVYIGSPGSLGFKVGEPVFIYRRFIPPKGSNLRPGRKSCITSYCIATRIDVVKSAGRELMPFEKYRKLVGNKSVYDDFELNTKYRTLPNLTLIELLYCGYFGAGNNVNWSWLKDNGCWPDSHPVTFRYDRAQLEKIMQEGNVDVANVIVH